MVEAARLANELNSEQDNTNTQKTARHALETQLVEHAIHGDHAVMDKLKLVSVS